MRKLTLLLAGGLISTMSMGQTSSSDNFDSYTSGDYLGVVGADAGWTTWSGTGQGTSEDVMVTDANSNSASNSVFFEGGQGIDVVLDYGGEYNMGHFYTDFMINSDSGFYINLQGENPIGSTWALQLYVIDDSVNLDDASFLYYREEFTDEGNWVHVEIDIDLDSNVWTVMWDGDTMASFENASINQVASMNIYPLTAAQSGANHEFYVDDVNWSWMPTPRDVTFSVDMNYYDGDVGTLHVAGNYVNNWCGECNPMQDDDGDGVWETTVSIAADSIEWKYLWDNWAVNETLMEGMPCTKTAFGFTNRFAIFGGNAGEAVVLPTVCWEQCDTCIVPAGVADVVEAAPSVYPNPTNDVVNIEFASSVKDMNIAVMDLTGRVVLSNNAFNGTKAILNVSELPQGAYTIVGTSEDVRFTESIIIVQ